jgi:hypothetical protein
VIFDATADFYMPKVVHCKRAPPGSFVYIGRGHGSKWGNPFSHMDDTLAQFKVATREEAIAAYDAWLDTQPQLLAALWELEGVDLGCWCTPHACHGRVLLRRANPWMRFA